MITALSYHPDERLVRSTYDGVLTESDVTMYYSFVRCSVPLDQPYHELLDFAGLTGHQLSVMRLCEASESELIKSPVRGSGSRTAYVVTEPSVITMIHDFLAMSPALERQVRLFEQEALAEAWLNAPSR